jgi:hypothetical protein
MPRGRPRGSKKFEKSSIAILVWKVLKIQGYKLPLRYKSGKSVLLRGQHSVKVAVAAVAKQLKCSETTVWNAWSGFDPLAYELRWEKIWHDTEYDLAMTYRAEVALESLQREFGNREEFSHQEIEERAQELDDDRCYPDD